MTKQEILDYFSEINFMYNNAAMHDDLSNMLDKLLENRPEIVPCSKCERRHECLQDATFMGGTSKDFVFVKINYCSLGRKEKQNG